MGRIRRSLLLFLGGGGGYFDTAVSPDFRSPEVGISATLQAVNALGADASKFSNWRLDSTTVGTLPTI